MIAFKIVRVEGNKLVSPLADGSAKIIYTPGETILAPEGTGIFGFDRLHRARMYLDTMGWKLGDEYQLWRGEAFNKLPLPRYLVERVTSIQRAREIWGREVVRRSGFSYWFPGTRAWKAIRLEKRLA